MRILLSTVLLGVLLALVGCGAQPVAGQASPTLPDSALAASSATEDADRKCVDLDARHRAP